MAYISHWKITVYIDDKIDNKDDDPALVYNILISILTLAGSNPSPQLQR